MSASVFTVSDANTAKVRRLLRTTHWHNPCGRRHLIHRRSIRQLEAWIRYCSECRASSHFPTVRLISAHGPCRIYTPHRSSSHWGPTHLWPGDLADHIAPSPPISLRIPHIHRAVRICSIARRRRARPPSGIGLLSRQLEVIQYDITHITKRVDEALEAPETRLCVAPRSIASSLRLSSSRL
jgi:hypothetical protein